MMHEREKSDPAIGAGKPANKADATFVADAAEPVEQRAGTEGNASEQSTHRTQGRERRIGENPPYGILGGTMETSASFEARSAPSSYPTGDYPLMWIASELPIYDHSGLKRRYTNAR